MGFVSWPRFRFVVLDSKGEWAQGSSDEDREGTVPLSFPESGVSPQVQHVPRHAVEQMGSPGLRAANES